MKKLLNFCFNNKKIYLRPDKYFPVSNFRKTTMDTIQPKYLFKHVEVSFRIKTATILHGILNSSDSSLEATCGASYFKLLLSSIYKNL